MNLSTIAIILSGTGLFITIMSIAFFAGKWTGIHDYLHGEIEKLDKGLKGLHTDIHAMSKENKDDRHALNERLQRWQEKLWDEINTRIENFESRMENRVENHRRNQK